MTTRSTLSALAEQHFGVANAAYDPHAAYEVETAIQIRGLQRKYIAFLSLATGAACIDDLEGKLWLIARAGPASRCRAALLAIGVMVSGEEPDPIVSA